MNAGRLEGRGFFLDIDMNILRQLAAFTTGTDWCPVCDSEIIVTEAGYHACKSPTCSVVVDYTRGVWRFGGESRLRQLPGLAGINSSAT